MKNKKRKENDGKRARIENFQNQIKELFHRREILESGLLAPNEEISELKSILHCINENIINKKKFIESTITEIEELGKESGNISVKIAMAERDKSRIMLAINQNKRDEETIQEELKDLR